MNLSDLKSIHNYYVNTKINLKKALKQGWLKFRSFYICFTEQNLVHFKMCSTSNREYTFFRVSTAHVVTTHLQRLQRC